jgi:hypothetical protein
MVDSFGITTEEAMKNWKEFINQKTRGAHLRDLIEAMDMSLAEMKELNLPVSNFYRLNPEEQLAVVEAIKEGNRKALEIENPSNIQEVHDCQHEDCEAEGDEKQCDEDSSCPGCKMYFCRECLASHKKRRR